MKETPLLMCGPMVTATLEGRKGQTRRVLNPQPSRALVQCSGNKAYWKEPSYHADPIRCPYGAPGDRIWVRENFQFVQANSDGQRGTFKSSMPFTIHDYRWIEYAATPRFTDALPWRPSIHMPRWASRITLEIVNVRVERVQEISPNDARAEGVITECRTDHLTHDAACHIEAYESLWGSLNAKRDGGIYAWTANPWVWVIEFKLLSAGLRP